MVLLVVVVGGGGVGGPADGWGRGSREGARIEVELSGWG